MPSTQLSSADVLGSLKKDVSSQGLPPWAVGGWLSTGEGQPDNAAASYKIAPGAVAGAKFVWFDILLDSDIFVTFTMTLGAGESKAVAVRQFSPLTQCQTRLCFPLGGIDLAAVDRVVIKIIRKTDLAARFCLTPVNVTDTEPGRLENPTLPKGPLVDELGQSTLHARVGKTPNADALVRHLKKKLDDAPRQSFPAHFSRWGGWKDRKVEATGFFRTYHDGKRWWLVDPDGHLFWSSGLDCTHATIDHETVYQTRHMNLRPALAWMPDPNGPYKAVYHTNPYHGPEPREINYLPANFMRAFGPEKWHEAWSTVAQAELRGLGFNTAGDWSDEPAMSRGKTPYVLPLDLKFTFPNVPRVTGAFPDVFDPRMESDAAEYAENIRPTRDDPAMIGYFLTNEPSVSWQMIDEKRGLAEAMLVKTPSCASRKALTEFLRKKYGDSPGLAKAWGVATTLEAVANGPWRATLTDAAQADLTAFSTVMLERLCRIASDACRKVDPNHLNLGLRWWSFPPAWALRAMGCFDVVTFNYYLPKVRMVTYGATAPEPDVEEVVASLKRPMMIGEWHVGSLDGGLASAGLARVRDQETRAEVFRVYTESAAAAPWCVGAHWFNMYDRNALSSTSSNENYNIGLLDLCHVQHEPICRAARETNERLYAVASGVEKPYGVEIEYLHPSR
ncbi:MAG: hypothetical protein K8S99_13405 [Planctomycetes bacterium]|nr:hypothetical protein [Planctomycetota bacterium]